MGKARFERTTLEIYKIDCEKAKASMGSDYQPYIDAVNVIRTRISESDKAYYQSIIDKASMDAAEYAKHKYVLTNPESTLEEINQAELILEQYTTDYDKQYAQIQVNKPVMSDGEFANYKDTITRCKAHYPDEIEIIEDYIFWITNHGRLYNFSLLYGNGDETSPEFIIKLDGTLAKRYNQSQTIELDITPESINASRNNHIHDASEVTTGVFDIARIPRGAMERCVTVENDTARFKLTTEDVQNGDTVKVKETKIMYMVVDQTKLNVEAGYTEYVAANALNADNLGDIPANQYVTLSGTQTLTNKTLTTPFIDIIKRSTYTYSFPNKSGTFALTIDKLANPYALSISQNGGAAQTYDGTKAISVSITPDSVGASPAGHTHLYAGSATVGGPANSTKASIIIKLNGGTTEGTNMFTFNGSTAKTLNINPATVGASPAGHTHSYAGSESVGGPANSTKGSLTLNVNGTKYGFDGSTNKEVALNPNTVGASPAGHTHNYAGSSSPGGAANSTKASIVITLNGGVSEGTNKFTFDGSTAKTINITPSSIGASGSAHTHNYAGSSSPGGAATSALKWTTARTITLSGFVSGSVSIDGSANVTLNTSIADSSVLSPSWDNITGKPTTATRWPSWSEVTGKPTTFTPSSHSHSWTEITGKPSSFTPSAHTHSTLTLQIGGNTQVTYDGGTARTFNVTLAALGAAAASHTHDDRYFTESESDGRYARASHTHSQYLQNNTTSTQSTSNLTISGSFTAKTFFKSSDKRLKRNIEFITTDILEKAYNIDAKTFELYESKDLQKIAKGLVGTIKSCGYIADEVEEFAPYLINLDENGVKQLDYNGFEAIRSEAIKSVLKWQSQKIEKLESVVKLLCEKLDVQINL